MPKTSIVIGSYYVGARLDHLIQFLRAEAFEDYRILVDEQHGVDRRPEGFAKTYNRLINAAFADQNCGYVWILGDDVLPHTTCLEKTQHVLEKDSTIGVIFPVEIWKEDTQLVTLEPETGRKITKDEAMRTGPEQFEQLFAGFACACIRREAWITVGPMNESIGIGYCEDLDWGLRCWEQGYRVVNYRSEWFLHERGATYNQLVKEGLMTAAEPYQAAERVKDKWPWLWSGESLTAQLDRLKTTALRNLRTR